MPRSVPSSSSVNSKLAKRLKLIDALKFPIKVQVPKNPIFEELAHPEVEDQQLLAESEAKNVAEQYTQLEEGEEEELLHIALSSLTLEDDSVACPVCENGYVVKKLRELSCSNCTLKIESSVTMNDFCQLLADVLLQHQQHCQMKPKITPSAFSKLVLTCSDCLVTIIIL